MAYFCEYLLNNNEREANGDYSVSPVSFSFSGELLKTFVVDRLVVGIGTADSEPDRYGGVSLENGVEILLDSTQLYPSPIMTIGDYLGIGATLAVHEGYNQLILDLSGVSIGTTDTLSVVLNDNFSHLGVHTFCITGTV